MAGPCPFDKHTLFLLTKTDYSLALRLHENIGLIFVVSRR
jgi:hypothetical protein